MGVLPVSLRIGGGPLASMAPSNIRLRAIPLGARHPNISHPRVLRPKALHLRVRYLRATGRQNLLRLSNAAKQS